MPKLTAQILKTRIEGLLNRMMKEEELLVMIRRRKLQYLGHVMGRDEWNSSLVSSIGYYILWDSRPKTRPVCWNSTPGHYRKHASTSPHPPSMGLSEKNMKKYMRKIRRNMKKYVGSMNLRSVLEGAGEPGISQSLNLGDSLEFFQVPEPIWRRQESNSLHWVIGIFSNPRA